MSARGIWIVTGLFVIAFALLAIGRCGYRKIDALQTLENAMAEMRSEYPRLATIAPDRLEPLMEGGKCLLLDMRGEEEFAVSRIGDARNQSDVDAIQKLYEEAGGSYETIVIYGAIGFRSAELADELQRRGLPVQHLEGGIFRWINLGNPILGPDGEKATLVHPYNRIWGRLIEEEHRFVLEEE